MKNRSPKFLAKMLSDEYNMKIISASYIKPVSVQEMSIMFDIPIAVCYRRVKKLVKDGVLNLYKRKLSSNGKRISLYNCDVKEITLRYKKGSLVAYVEERNKDNFCNKEKVNIMHN